MEWNVTLLDLIFDSSTGLADYQCKQLLNDRYFRVDKILSSNIALDDVSQTATLISLADSIDLSDVLDWLDKYVLLPQAEKNVDETPAA